MLGAGRSLFGLCPRLAGLSCWWMAGLGRVCGGNAFYRWFATFEYKIDGKMFGGTKDVPAYTPDSYLKSGVPAGTL